MYINNVFLFVTIYLATLAAGLAIKHTTPKADLGLERRLMVEAIITPTIKEHKREPGSAVSPKSIKARRLVPDTNGWTTNNKRENGIEERGSRGTNGWTTNNKRENRIEERGSRGTNGWTTNNKRENGIEERGSRGTNGWTTNNKREDGIEERGTDRRMIKDRMFEES